LYSDQVLAVIAATLAITPVVAPGRLFQVIPVSVQVLLVPCIAGPFAEPFVTHNRILAFWMVPFTPLTVKRI
jgi:hypothetical protein